MIIRSWCFTPLLIVAFASTAQAADPRVPASPPPLNIMPRGSTLPEMVPLEEPEIAINYGRNRNRGLNWEGFFVGASIGGALGDSKWNSVTGAQAARNQMPGSAEIRGVNFGGQGGYNWQYGPLVLGGEVSARTGSLQAFVNTQKSVAANPASQVGKVEADLLLNTSLRLGYAAGQNLYLLRAGASALNVKYTNDYDNITTTGARKTATIYGPSFGLGLERDLGAGFSARVQYDYTSFVRRDYIFTDSTGQKSALPISQSLHLVTAGLDYRFGAVGQLNGVASPTINQEITGEVGLRGTYDKVDYSKTFYNPTVKSQRDSFLEFNGQTLAGTEIFTILEHDTGIFLKGTIGFGRQAGSNTTRNQDFAPAAAHYSDIRGTQKDSRSFSASADAGLQLWRTKDYKVGAFIGAGLINHRLNSYGCRQLEANAAACQAGVSEASVVITDDQSWRMGRLGLRGEAIFFNRLRIVADAAWIPRFDFKSNDNHWLNAQPWDVLNGKGSGNNGLQGELVVNYDITPNLSAGVGGRYTALTLRKGEVQMGQLAPARYEFTDTSGFLQLSYRFKSDRVVK